MSLVVRPLRVAELSPLNNRAVQRARSKLHRWKARPPGNKGERPWTAEDALGQAQCLFASGAVLGPMLDGQHSRYHVLKYKDPFIVPLPALGYNFETCWWVPMLFGAAAVILGLSHPLLDSLAHHDEKPSDVSRKDKDRSWAKTMLGIAAFAIQYWLSGVLESKLSNPLLLYFLGLYAVACWAIFDCTVAGLLMALLTALLGPAVEVFLINELHLYTYGLPQFWGIPNWIACIYFCGSPAVGNLGRMVWQEFPPQHKPLK